MKQIEIRDFLQHRYVSAPTFSPDGRFAAFVVQTPDVEGNTYKGDLWLLEVAAKQTRRLTCGGDAKRYLWTKEGTLLFPAVRDPAVKKKQEAGEPVSSWYEIDPEGGEAKLAFTLPLKTAELTAVDADRYVIRAPFDNTMPDLDALTEQERSELLQKKQKPAYEVLEEAPFWSNGGGFTSGIRQRLYLYSRASGELQPLTDPWFHTMFYDVCGTKLAYKGYAWQGFRGVTKNSGIWLRDLDSGETTCLLPEDTLFSSVFTLREDGSITLAASAGETWGSYQYPDIWQLSPDGSRRKLADYGYGIGSGDVNSDARLGGGREQKQAGGKFYFVSTLDDSAVLRCLDENGVLSGDLTPKGSCDSFDVFGDHLLVCGFYDGLLAELYLDGERVTFFNDAYLQERAAVTPEPHTVMNGETELHGWAMKPAGYEPGRKYPAILHIHGGPRTAFGAIHHHEMQVWANAGYFVFYCNPRGSEGRGDAFGDLLGKYGTIDYEDLMAFADEMLVRYPDADGSRFGVTGGSYGGFMTNWIIGHTDRFAAAVSQRSISNWIAFEHTSDIGHTFTYNNQGTLTRDNVEKLWEHSPLKYADRCKTPTLFIHADADYRCWMVEGISMFTALKMHGCEARMCLFHGESHELSRSGKPQNRIRRMEEILGWMDNYLKGGAV